MTDRLLRAALLLALMFTVVACQSGSGNPAADDELPPTIAITGPAAHIQQFVGEAFTLTGVAADETELAGVTVQAGSSDPVTATVDADGNWSVEITPDAEGLLELTATASDAAGNTARANIAYQAYSRTATYLVTASGFYAGDSSGPVVRIHPSGGGNADLDSRPDSAIVLVNGTRLQPVPDQPRLGFQGALDAPLAEGSTVNLEIDIDGVIITATVVVPHRPVVTSPSTGDNLPADAPVTVTWSVGSDPDYFKTLLLGADPGSRWSVNIDGNERSSVLDLEGLDTSGADLRVQVVGFNRSVEDAFTGPVSAGSSITAEGRTPNADMPIFTIGTAP